jgi:nucleoside-diphosphate-sugar epimerase
VRVVITGAGGNLGGKLTAHLQAMPWCSAITGVDPKPLADAGKFRAIAADLRDPHDRRWIDPVEAADAVVHFAAQSPAPDSSWPEAAQSLDMTFNLLQHVGHKPCRFVFASSNHVMGGYKDTPLPAGETLSGETPPSPGTRYFDGVEFRRPQAYGGSKLIGERAVAARCAATQLTGVNIRIGWVQPGENRPETVHAHGGGKRIGPDLADAAELARATSWYRGMWMSNRDFLQLMEKAITAPADRWPARAIVVSGVSNNTGTKWNLEDSRRWLGYAPIDDIAAG